MTIKRPDAWVLLNEYVKSPQLIKHSLAVEAAMCWHAEKQSLSSEEIEKWAITGLMHDFDYEQHPDPVEPDGHPFFGVRTLREIGYSEDILRAILGHATYSGVPRDTLMSKTLFAVDELSGFITACVLVRPDKSLGQLQVSSVKKKMKDKAFAKGCNREDMILGAQELGIEMDLHIQNVIHSIKPIVDQLGLQP